VSYADSMRTLGDIVRQLREKREITQTELAARLGITKQAMSAMELGDRRISRTVLEAIAKALDADVSVFETGVLDPDQMIPIYDGAAASPAYDPDQVQQHDQMIHRNGLTTHEQAFAVTVRGDSMSPAIMPGDVLYCEPLLDEHDHHRLVDGREVVVTIKNTRGVTTQVGQWAWLSSSAFQINKINPAFPPQRFTIDSDEVLRISVVVAIVRRR